MHLHDPDAQKVGIAMANTVAQLAEEDFPHAWPTLFESLLGALQTAEGRGADNGTLCTILTALYQVMQGIANRPRDHEKSLDQSALRNVAQLVTPTACRLWAATSAEVAAPPCRRPVVEALTVLSQLLCTLQSLPIAFPQACWEMCMGNRRGR